MATTSITAPAVGDPVGDWCDQVTDNLNDTCVDSLLITTDATYYNATAEAVVISASVSGAFTAGDRMRVMVKTPIACATAGHAAVFSLRLTNISGTIIGRTQWINPGINYDQDVTFFCDYDVPSTGTIVVVLTCKRDVGATSNVYITVSGANHLHMSLHRLAATDRSRTV